MRGIFTYLLITALLIGLTNSVNAGGYIEWIFPGAYWMQQEKEGEVNQLVFSAEYQDLLREYLGIQRTNLLKASGLSFSGVLPVGFTGVEDYWGLCIKRSDLGFDFSTTPSQKSSLNSQIWSGESSYSLNTPFLNSRMSIGAGVTNDNDFIWNCSVTSQPIRFLEAGYRHRSDVESYLVYYSYQGEDINIPDVFSVSSDQY